MTVETEFNSQEFEGNDSAIDFPFYFPFFNDSEIFASIFDANGNETELVQGVDYQLTSTKKRDGGSIRYPVSGFPLPTGSTLVVTRELPVTQTASVRNQGRFNASVHETVFDKLIMILQQFLNKALWRTGGNNKMLQSLDMGNNKIVNLKNAENSGDAVNLGQADGRFANISGDTMTSPLAGPNSQKSDDYMPQLQITEVIDERMASAPEFDPDNFQDYGLVTQVVSDQFDYGSI